jgi:ribose/xylose/arabinose/galactoside ABC-type transport system permease subunit
MARLVSPGSAPRSSEPLRSALRRLGRSEYLVLWLSVGYVVALAPFTPGFISPENMANVLVALLPLFLVALGQTLVLITGGIDLSATSVIGLTSVVGAMIVNERTGWMAGNPFAASIGVMAMLLIGALVGLSNGLAIAVLRMPAFIVTLTGMMFFSGLAIWITESKNIGGLPASFVMVGANPIISFVIVMIAGVFVHLMLSRSLLGRWIYAVGHNTRAAHVSGVPVRAVTIVAYVGSGICAALASILYTGQAETGSPVLGQRILLDVIGATILGGTSLFGGKGKVLWTLCGVLFLKLVDNSLNLLNFSIFSITMVKGGVILLAAMLDVTRVRLGGHRP